MGYSWHRSQESDPCFLFESITYDSASMVLYINMTDVAVDEEGYKKQYSYHGVPENLALEFIKARGDKKMKIYPRIKDHATATEEPTRHGTEPWG